VGSESVAASWRVPDGGERSETVDVEPGTAGGTVPIRLDEAGNPVG